MKSDDVDRLIEQRQALAHKALDEMVAENQRLGLYDEVISNGENVTPEVTSDVTHEVTGEVTLKEKNT